MVAPLVAVSRWLAPLIAGSAIALGTVATDVNAGKPKQGPFVEFSLGAAVGTVCPGSGGACSNIAAEPAIRGARDGSFYASSENGLGGGTLAWKSGDGGPHYAALVSPDALSGTQDTGFAPRGGDTDLAVPTAPNATYHYSAYVASLSLANIDVSMSADAAPRGR